MLQPKRIAIPVLASFGRQAGTPPNFSGFYINSDMHRLYTASLGFKAHLWLIINVNFHSRAAYTQGRYVSF